MAETQITFVALGLIAATAVTAATWLWPIDDPLEIEHGHATLDADDPHLAGSRRVGDTYRHRHAFVIDSYHPEWPRPI